MEVNHIGESRLNTRLLFCIHIQEKGYILATPSRKLYPDAVWHIRPARLEIRWRGQGINISYYDYSLHVV